MQYTPKQQDAISTIDKNLQIIACAGSGKTQVVSARIINILKEKAVEGVTPGNIVAFTFTEKAAGELKDRIYRLAKEELGTDQGLADMFVGTIHGYCLNLLQSPPLYKYLKYSVLTDIQQRLFIDRHPKASGLTSCPLVVSGFLKRWLDSSLYQQILTILGEGDVIDASVPPDVWASYDAYHSLLDSKSLLDFTTILVKALEEIVVNSELRTLLAQKVKYLVVDEYQDVNPLQEALIHELHNLGANLCVVGDDDQTIYAWRGSEISNIIQFITKYPSVASIPLNDNFRSSKGIVESARKVIEFNRDDRLPKKMVASGHQVYAHGDVLALDFPAPTAEATYIAEKIDSLLGALFQDKPDSAHRGLSYSDFAVLLRSVKNDASPIIAELDAHKIPYVVIGMSGLFSTSEVHAMVTVFHYLASFIHPEFGLITRSRLRSVLDSAQFGLTSAQLDAAVAWLDDKKAKIGPQIVQELILQRVYLDFMKEIDLREENITRARARVNAGEIAYYNLGKFSQVISDYEQIQFITPADKKFQDFSGFLYYQAPGYYPEGWQENIYSRPDAVQILTVHQAKGMEWPIVFIPCLRQNRFPSSVRGGRTVWHVIPNTAVRNSARYRGSVEDERRLFYVALTRAEKWLFCSWSPVPDTRQKRSIYKKASIFYNELTASSYVLTQEPPSPVPLPKLPPKQRRDDITMPLTFSDLKYYFFCSYLFKLRYLYGFNPPIDQALGYGKSLHDALAEIHSESIKGFIPGPAQVPDLISEHLHLPFASDVIIQALRIGAEKALTRYLIAHADDLAHLEHAEKIVELKLQDGIVVNGRIDLIRRTDTGEIAIVDFKSDDRAQEESITKKQLHVYAVGYEQLTGKSADQIEIHDLDSGKVNRQLIDNKLITSTLHSIVQAGNGIRSNILPRLPRWEPDKCGHCDFSGLCRSKPSI